MFGATELFNSASASWLITWHKRGCWPKALVSQIRNNPTIPHTPGGHSSVLTAWRLASRRASNPRESKVETAMHFRTSSQKSHTFVATRSHRSHRSALSCVRAQDTRRRGPLEALLAASYLHCRDLVFSLVALG